MTVFGYPFDHRHEDPGQRRFGGRGGRFPGTSEDELNLAGMPNMMGCGHGIHGQRGRRGRPGRDPPGMMPGFPGIGALEGLYPGMHPGMMHPSMMPDGIGGFDGVHPGLMGGFVPGICDDGECDGRRAIVEAIYIEDDYSDSDSDMEHEYYYSPGYGSRFSGGLGGFGGRFLGGPRGFGGMGGVGGMNGRFGGLRR